MKKSTENRKTSKLLRAAVLLAGILVLSACGKGDVHHGGKGTDYPFTWKSAGKGRVSVTLDGSAAPDYGWSVEVEGGDENAVVQVEIAGKEKKGKVTYRIIPIGEGTATVTFIRSNPVEDSSGSYVPVESLPYIPDDTKEVTGTPREYQEDETGDTGSEEDKEPEHGSSGDIHENTKLTDCVCRISMRFEVTMPKPGKFETEGSENRTDQFRGLISGEENGVAYRMCADNFGRLIIRVKAGDELWTATQESAVPAVTERIPDETAVGAVYDTPDVDENGNALLLDVYPAGHVGEEDCFIAEGFYPGSTSVKISAPSLGKQLVLELLVDDSCKVSLSSATVRDYTPTAEELAYTGNEWPEEDN